MTSRREYEMLFRLSAQQGGTFGTVFTQAQAQISAMQQKIVDLGKVQSQIESYQKQQAAIEATRKKLEVLQQQYDNIQREIGETEGFSATLENRLLSKKQAIEKVTASMEAQTQRAQALGAALQDAGVDTGNLTAETDRLTTQMQQLRQEQENVISTSAEMGRTGADAVRDMQEAIAASGIYDSMKKVLDVMDDCADASVGFETALVGVEKTTDLTEAELAAMAASVKQLSTEIPVTTDEMLAIGEVAGQLGIAKENLLDFSTVMSMLSTATSMTADEGATMLAQFANITKMDPAMYSNLASSIVSLGNSYATTEQKITDMAQGIAASASLAGMSEADMVGISAAVSSLGIEAQMGGTAVSKLISILMTAVETGDNLEDLAWVAGMTADEFAHAWGVNAAGAMEKFIVGLSDTDRLGQSAIVTLTDLGITESRMQRTLLSLSNSGDLLTRTIDTANTAWRENTALSAEAEKRYATTASKQQMMANAANNLKIAIGDNYTPALRQLYDTGKDILVEMTKFVEQNPALVKAVSAAVGVVGAATAGLAAYTAVVKLASSASLLFTSTIPALPVIAAATVGLAALTAGIVAMTAEENSAAQELRELSAASREEYDQLQETKAAYEEACAVYGDTSEEAMYLAWRVDEMTKAFEANKQSMDDYVADSQAASDSMRSMLQANREAGEQIDRNEGTTLALVNRLRELANQTDQTVATQEEMKAIIAELNSTVPELALNYDDVIGGVTDYAAAIEASVKAEAARQRYEQNQQGMVDALNAKYEAEQKLKVEKEYQAAAQERYNKAYAEYQALLSQRDEEGVEEDEPNWLKIYNSDTYKEYQAALDALNKLNGEVERHTSDLAIATEEYDRLNGELVEYVETVDSLTASKAELTNRIGDAVDMMTALSEAYKLSYEDAYTSVSGQYNLWTEVDKAVATGSQTITDALASQTDYWKKYNDNLVSLGDRADDIDGLREMIASFADGSEGSVNAVAGMAKATDDELADMVENWKALQLEQDNVATSIADLKTNFTEEMDLLQQQLAEDIQAMDLSEDAAASGRATIQGFIDGAEALFPQVEAAYTRIATAAMDAIDRAMEIHSPSREMAWRSEMAWTGFINQAHAMEPDVRRAMADTAKAGMDAASIQAITFDPAIFSAWAAGVSAREPYEARMAIGGGYQPSINLSITVEGDASEKTVDALRDYGDEFVDRVRGALAEIEYDNTRRGY